MINHRPLPNEELAWRSSSTGIGWPRRASCHRPRLVPIELPCPRSSRQTMVGRTSKCKGSMSTPASLASETCRLSPRPASAPTSPDSARPWPHKSAILQTRPRTDPGDAGIPHAGIGHGQQARGWKRQRQRLVLKRPLGHPLTRPPLLPDWSCIRSRCDRTCSPSSSCRLTSPWGRRADWVGSWRPSP